MAPRFGAKANTKLATESQASSLDRAPKRVSKPPFVELNKKEFAKISDYYSSKKILIVDNSSSSRSAISKSLTSLGAKTANLILAPSYNDASELVKEERPEVLITEYQLGDRFGLDLIHLQKDVIPDMTERMGILATGSSSESCVAEAAEEDVDGYILKPFTGNGLKEQFIKAARSKMDPSTYLLLIQEGKRSLKDQNFDLARKLFEKAQKFTRNPALACFYLGNICSRGYQDDLGALDFYKEGLKYNKIHYRCLVGSFEVLDRLGRVEECFNTLQTILLHFPMSPQLLQKLFHFMIQTKNFRNVDRYYDYYSKMDHRSKELTKTVSAGLITCGKFFLKEGEIERGVESLQRAALSSRRDPHFVGIIVELLKSYGLEKEAQKIARGK